MGIKETHPLFPVCKLFTCKHMSGLESIEIAVILAA